jgi:asparagine synthase (glutamine-hydrolysing)
MTRWLAGSFDPRARAEESRLAEALAPERATVVRAGPLALAYSGPPADSDAALCLLDGFLDNATELAAELGLAGATAPETLLLAGWKRWELELLGKMRGEFALLLWDPERRRGLLARDQLGVRSLFLHESGGTVRFASEIRQLLALLPRRPQPDAVSVAHWVTMSRRPGSATLFEDIRRLDPGSALALSEAGAREHAYWRPSFREPLERTKDQLAQDVREALERAVARRVSDDGTTCVLMSGGLDSSSIAALAATQAPGRVSACSAVFPEHPAVDESALIAELKDTLHLGGITAEVRPGGLLASAIESSAEWQLPLRSWGDFWALPLLRAAAQQGARVTLGGDGGDELFGARAYLLADRLRAGHPHEAFALAHELPGAGDRPPRRQLAAILAEVAVEGALPGWLHSPVMRMRERRQLPRWLRPELARGLLESDDPLAWKRLDGPRWWAHPAYGLTRGVEETGVFEHQRRRAATAGLEARHPLFDLDLLELCLRAPPLETFDRYRSRPLLRAATTGLLPDSVRLRPQKALFDSLLVDCIDGPDGAIIRRMVSEPGAQIGAYVDRRALERALFQGGDGNRGSFGWMWQLWRLVTAEIWLRGQAGEAPTPEGLQASDATLVMRDPTRAA